MSGLASVLGAVPWFAWIPIVAIICGSISQSLRWRYQHAERMELIRQGIHPDSVVGTEKAYTDHEL